MGFRFQSRKWSWYGRPAYSVSLSGCDYSPLLGWTSPSGFASQDRSVYMAPEKYEYACLLHRAGNLPIQFHCQGVIAYHSWGGQGPSGFASHDRSVFTAPEKYEYARLRRHPPFYDSFLLYIDSAAKIRRIGYESRPDRRLADREE